jgi:hypothetical protein
MGNKEIGLSSTNLHPGSVSLIPNVSSRVVGVEEKHENQGREAGIEEGRDRYGSMTGCTRRKTKSMFGLQFNR